MTYEFSPPSPSLSQCKIDRELVALAFEELKLRNDARQKSITEQMVAKTKNQMWGNMNHLQEELLEELLEEIVWIAGLEPHCQPIEITPYCSRISRPTEKFAQDLLKEDQLQTDINDAIETFGCDINSYNPLFIEYLENYSLYNSDCDTDVSMDVVLTWIYGSDARETHLHPNGSSDIGCPACTCQILMQAFELKDTTQRKSLLSRKEQERTQWLLDNIATA